MTGTLRPLVEAFDPEVPIERAWMPPSEWYTDSALWELERRAIFARAWHPAVRVDELHERGAYRAGCHVGEPWVVVRDDDGELAAFSNTCRHKGREVVTGSGVAGERLVCGYHAWAYDLAGRLRSAPKMAGIEGFDREAMSLPRLALDRWGPWAFVSHGSPAPMAEQHPELDAALRATEWERLVFVDRRSWTIECNWKVYVDNYLDGGYHIPHMHPSLDAQLDMASYRTVLYGASSIQTSDAAGAPDERTKVDAQVRIGGGAIYAWVYPCFMLNRYGPCLDTNLVIPLGPDRCRVEYEFWFLDGDGRQARAFVEQSIEQADLTQREDIAICESVQRGLKSAHYRAGRYAPRLELGEHHFHRLLATDLRAALEPSRAAGRNPGAR